MELHEALEQISTIRAQVAQTQTFRGYRAITVGCTGLLGLVAAAAQSICVPDPQRFVRSYVDHWSFVAVASILLVATELTLRWFRTDSRLAREQTIRAVEQFLPCLLAGGVITWVLAYRHAESASLLPGMWAICFSLGVFASLRQMPPAIKWAGVYYMLAGAASLIWAQGDYAFSPWAMAGSFGGGQLLIATVLYRTLEQTDDQ